MSSVKLLCVFLILRSALQVGAVPNGADSTEVQQDGTLALALAADDTCLGTQDSGSTLGEPACGTELLQTRGLSVHPAREAEAGATISHFSDEGSTPLEKAPYPRTVNKTSQFTSQLLKHGYGVSTMPNETAMRWPSWGTTKPTESTKTTKPKQDTCGKSSYFHTRRYCLLKNEATGIGICATDCSMMHAELHSLCETLKGTTAEKGVCAPKYSCPVAVDSLEHLSDLIGMPVPSMLSTRLKYVEFLGPTVPYLGCGVENSLGTVENAVGKLGNLFR
jgi:hypothetical protein